jgi:enamine deaminase RidA (YjgF/YER057c/UK114 family)
LRIQGYEWGGRTFLLVVRGKPSLATRERYGWLPRSPYPGSTAMTPSGLVGKGDPYAQTIQTLKTIELALQQAGASLTDVVRTRMYLANIDQWQEVGRAHGEIFGTIRPATTIVEVKRLIDPDMLVEIEADAIISQG